VFCTLAFAAKPPISRLVDPCPARRFLWEVSLFGDAFHHLPVGTNICGLATNLPVRAEVAVEASPTEGQAALCRVSHKLQSNSTLSSSSLTGVKGPPEPDHYFPKIDWKINNNNTFYDFRDSYALAFT